MEQPGVEPGSGALRAVEARLPPKSFGARDSNPISGPPVAAGLPVLRRLTRSLLRHY